jgi:hypothetical protein
MEITCNYLGRTGGDTVRINSSLPFESIATERIERKFSPPQNVRVKKVQHCLMVNRDGTFALELTKMNAAFINAGIQNEIFELAEPDQQIFLDQMLAGAIKEPEEKKPEAKRKPGRPSKQPVAEEAPPAPTNIVSA